MKFIVKNTTLCGPFDLLCPHACMGCERLGKVLCERCKKYIISQRVDICPLCKQILPSGKFWGCQECELSLERVWVAGWRDGVLARMAADYKYQGVRALTEVLVEILNETLPTTVELARNGLDNMVVVPLPTIGRHVRERGLDHTDRLARGLARQRGWQYQRVLERAVDTVQVGTKAALRRKQAAQAYMTQGRCEVNKTYLLVDDIWTTGATMLAAAQVLREAGAQKILGVVLATGKDQQVELKNED